MAKPLAGSGQRKEPSTGGQPENLIQFLKWPYRFDDFLAKGRIYYRLHKGKELYL